MGKALLVGFVLLVAWLASSRQAREEAAELARDASDWLMLLTLRATSGFAADVPIHVQREERERRLRWR